MSGSLAKEIGKTGPFESLEQEVLLNCIRTADFLMWEMVQVLKPSGLSPTQYNVLRILRGVGAAGLACQEIAARMIARDPDLTRLLDRLEKRGLVERQRQSDDRRVVRTTITPAGLAIVAELDAPINAGHHRVLGHLGPTRLKVFLELLEAARQNARE
jgi:DNA-binding MarR family transcriptional regulator